MRPCVESDIPWMLDVAQRVYPPFDPVWAAEFGKRVIANDSVITVRNDHAFLIAAVSALPWEPTVFRARSLFLASDPQNKCMAGYKLVRDVVSLTRKAGIPLILRESTGLNFGVIAKRLGGVEESPSYVL